MDHQDFDIGTKIRTYRKEQGVSIQVLAQQANITPSMLSQIERNLANPSINTLKLISHALNVPLFCLFTGTETEEQTIVRRDMRKTIKNPSEGYEYELLTPDSNGSIEFCMLRLPANGDTGTAVTTHNGEEVAVVLEGTLDLVLNQTTYTLEVGDSARIPAMTPHVWQNNGVNDGALVFAITPPCF